MDDPVLEACGLTEPGDDPRQLALTIPRPASGESLRALFSFFFLRRGTRGSSREHRRSEAAVSRVNRIY